MTDYTEKWRISFPEGPDDVAVHTDVEDTAATTDAAISGAKSEAITEAGEAADAKIDAATENVVYQQTPQAAWTREEDDIAYTVAFQDGKRTWLESDTRGYPTQWSLQVLVEALSPYFGGGVPDTRMNVLLMVTDDMDVRSVGAFGGPTGLTPNLDALAADAMCFDRGHVTNPVCQPSRSVMVTGRYPHRNGARGFEDIDSDCPVITDSLRMSGYLNGILGKTDHLTPEARFQWDHLATFEDLGMGRNPTRYHDETAAVISEAFAAGKPWFLMANAHDPHRPFSGSDREESSFTPAQRATYPAPSSDPPIPDDPIPGFLPQLDDVHTEYAGQYLHSVRRADDVVGAVLTAIQEAGQLDNTLIVCLSDNGMSFPFAKANTYLRGSATPLIVRWPGNTTPGSRNGDLFVSGIDLMPTILDAVGIPLPDGMDGISFAPLLTGEGDTLPRDNVLHTQFDYQAQGQDPDTQVFEMRCCQDIQYGYIWNAWSNGTKEYNATSDKASLTYPAWEASTDPTDMARLDFYKYRQVEELYDMQADPDCLNDLSTDPAYADVMTSMRQRVSEFVDSTGDPLADQYHADIGV